MSKDAEELSVDEVKRIESEIARLEAALESEDEQTMAEAAVEIIKWADLVGVTLPPVSLPQQEILSAIKQEIERREREKRAHLH
jgi:hypothetical protein